VGAVNGLRDAGNSVVVVEHETEIMHAADLLIDIGPGAGESGGRLVYSGPPEGIEACAESLTGQVLNGRSRVHAPRTRRTPKAEAIKIVGASGNNLKNIDVTIPLGLFCVVTGVSGAGKSTLVEETLFPALSRKLRSEALPVAPYRELRGANVL